MNDNDRAQWIDNDEGLHDWWQSWRRERRADSSKRTFIAQNRERIDAIINNVLEGNKPAHYLKYDDPNWPKPKSTPVSVDQCAGRQKCPFLLP